MRRAIRPAWSDASAFIGYKMSALMPSAPADRCRAQWSRSGIKKHSVLPEPVPVVTIAVDGRRLEKAYAAGVSDDEHFPPQVGPLCAWCDVRAHCPEGQLAGPEKSDWAALEPDGPGGRRWVR